MTTSVLRRLPAGFWIGLAVGIALAGWLDWYFSSGPGATGTDAGEVHGYAAMLVGFPLLWLVGPLLVEAAPSAGVFRGALMAVTALNVAAWGAGLHLTGRSVARRVRELHAPPR